MKHWSLRVKVGVYASVVTTVALVAGAVAMLVTLYFHQIEQLDHEIREDAEELVWDLSKFRDAPADPRDPIPEEDIPLPLRGHFLKVEGPDEVVVYRSAKLVGDELRGVPDQPVTRRIAGKLHRVGVFEVPPYTVRIGAPQDMVQRFIRNLGAGLLTAVPVTALVVFLGGVWLARRTTAPLAALSEAAERIHAGNPEERLPHPRANDEIARLTDVLNRSFDRLRRSYETATRFSADASHQLKTPLAILRAGLDRLSRDTPLTDVQAEEVDTLRRQTRRLDSLVENLLLLAQADAGRMNLQRERLDLAALLAASADDLDALCADRGIRLEKNIAGPLSVAADRRLITMVLQNLVENAAKYTPDGGTIRVAALAEHGQAVVRIGNTGGALPVAERATVFERFRRGSPVGGAVAGHGLGLNIAREMMRAHGGDLRINDTPENWVEFEFFLEPLP